MSVEQFYWTLGWNKVVINVTSYKAITNVLQVHAENNETWTKHVFTATEVWPLFAAYNLANDFWKLWFFFPRFSRWKIQHILIWWLILSSSNSTTDRHMICCNANWLIDFLGVQGSRREIILTYTRHYAP